MTPPTPRIIVRSMASPSSPRQSLNWLLIIALGAFALLRPLFRIIASQTDTDLPAVVPVALTFVITAVWVAAAMAARVASPVLTVTLAGLTYGVLSILLSAVLSPVLDGSLDGPLAHPIAIVPVLLLNAAWGAVAGGLSALLLRWRRD